MLRTNPLRSAWVPLIAIIMMGLVPIAYVQAEEKVSQGLGSIVVPVTNLQNFGKGQLLAILYKKVNRVEVNGVPFYRRIILPVKGESMTVTFKDIPFGEYAIAILHDMDKDLKMATTWVGIPDEDLGVSNNVKGGPLGGPKWDVAKFSHGKQDHRVSPIKMWQCYD